MTTPVDPARVAAERALDPERPGLWHQPDVLVVAQGIIDRDATIAELRADLEGTKAAFRECLRYVDDGKRPAYGALSASAWYVAAGVPEPEDGRCHIGRTKARIAELTAEVERLGMELRCAQIHADDRGASYREATARIAELTVEVEKMRGCYHETCLGLNEALLPYKEAWEEMLRWHETAAVIFAQNKHIGPMHTECVERMHEASATPPDTDTSPMEDAD